MNEINNDTHLLNKCYILVDDGIYKIVQYILDNYMYTVIPISSCENDDGYAYIMLLIRDFNNFDIFLDRIFHDRLLNVKMDFKCEYDFYKQFGRSFTIKWKSDFNLEICKRVSDGG